MTYFPNFCGPYKLTFDSVHLRELSPLLDFTDLLHRERSCLVNELRALSREGVR